jgi:PAS domain S-box-containing protein
MTQAPHDPAAALLSEIHSLHARLLGRFFDPRTGALGDPRLAESYTHLLRTLAGLDRQRLLDLQVVPESVGQRQPTSPPASELRALQHESEELLILRRTAEDAGYGFVVADRHGTIVYANRAMATLLREPDAESLRGKQLALYYSDETRDAFADRILPTVWSQGHWAGEVTFIPRTGEKADTVHSLFKVHGEMGTEPYVGCLIIDISPLRKTQEALRASEENFRALAENANDGILIATGSSSHAYANSRAAEITGYSVEELMRTGIHELGHPDERGRLRRYYQMRMETGSGPRCYETRIVRKDERVVGIEVTAGRTQWHGQVADIVIVRDITRRRMIEEALRESEARYSTLVEQAHDGVGIVQDDKIVFVSRPLARMLGYEVEELVGRHYLDLVAAEVQETTMRSYLERLGGQPPSGRVVAALRCKDGIVRTWDAYSTVIRYRGRPALMAVVRHLISDAPPEGKADGTGDSGQGA